MFYVLWYIMLFVVLYFFMFIFMYVIPKRKGTILGNKGLTYITLKYKLKIDKKKTNKLMRLLVGANAFIVSVPMYMAFFVPTRPIYMVIVCSMLFIVLIVTIYNLIGYILKKKGW